MLQPGDCYLAPKHVWHGDSVFIGDDEYDECWILDVFAPPREDLQMTSATDWRLAVDIGGTFTDFVLLDAASGTVAVDKVLTTPSNPLDGVRQGVTQLLAATGVRPADITAPIVHATTLITNALIEGKAGRAALVTTSGFGDTLLIRDEHRYDMYDLQIEFPAPPIPATSRSRSPSGWPPDGRLIADPSDADLAALTAAIAAADVDAVGICLLNSYVNGFNERRIAEHLRAELAVPVCISSEVSPQIREYPRMVTTACNAATMPVIGPYLDELQKWLSSEGFGGSVLMMLSNGGVVSADDAAAHADPPRRVRPGSRRARRELVRQAPRRGPPPVLRHGRHDGQGVPRRARRAGTDEHVRGRPRLPVQEGLRVPGVGAVGRPGRDRRRRRLARRAPTSSGCSRSVPSRPVPNRARRRTVAAAPSPPSPTPTSCSACSTPPGSSAGTCRSTRPPAGRPSAASARALGLDRTQTAAGIHEIVNQNMAAAARMHAVEHGIDLRGVSVLAFGGAGPVHACGVAELLESNRVIFPVNASVLSAFGTLVSPVRIDLARSMPRRLDDVDPAERDALLDELRAEGRRVLAAAGASGDDVRFRYGLDARYTGQGNEVTVWVGEGERVAGRRRRRRHRRVRGRLPPDLRHDDPRRERRARHLAPRGDRRQRCRRADARRHRHRRRAARRRPVVFDRDRDAVDTPVYRRAGPGGRRRFDGPAIIEERETTAVVRPGWSVEVPSTAA